MAEPGVVQITRSTRDRKLGGVAGGIGRYLGIDPIVVRLLFVIITLFGGTGILAYLAAWILIPEHRGQEPPPTERAPILDERGAKVACLVLCGLGVLIALGGMNSSVDLIVPLVLLGAGGWLLLRTDARDTDGTVDLRWASPAERAAAPSRVGSYDSVGSFDSFDSFDPAVDRFADRLADDLMADPYRADRDDDWRFEPLSDLGPWPPLSDPAPAVVTTRRTRVTPVVLAVLVLGLGLMACAVGVAGADIDVEAAMIASLGLLSIGMIVGSFLGGARGLLWVAVPIVLVLGAARSIDVTLDGAIGEQHLRPSVETLESDYRHLVGQLVLDLRDLDTDELARRTEVDVVLGIGELRVLVPDDPELEIKVNLGAGELRIFDRSQDGTGLDVFETRDAPEGAPVLVLDIEAGLAEVIVE